MTRDQWLEDLRSWVDTVRTDPRAIGVLSTGQQCAVALVLDKQNAHDLADTSERDQYDNFDMRPRGFTWLDCVGRVEPELLEACVKLQRELGL